MEASSHPQIDHVSSSGQAPGHEPKIGTILGETRVLSLVPLGEPDAERTLVVGGGSVLGVE